jgi:ABC-type nitrate/sulfonate/bicarbonate transport system substrate-binding protein
MPFDAVARAWAGGSNDDVIVAVASTEPTYEVIGGKHLTGLSDLMGHRVGIDRRRSTAAYALENSLMLAGDLMLEHDYTFVELPNGAARTAALATGAVYAIAARPPEAYKLVDAGYSLLGLERTYLPNSVQSAVVVNREWAQRHRSELVGTLGRMLRTAAWLTDRAKQDVVIAKLADVVVPNGGVVAGLAVDRSSFARALGQLEVSLPLEQVVDYAYLNDARRALGLPAAAL